jgi:hypothetical protein
MLIFDGDGRLLAQHSHEEGLRVSPPDLGSIPDDAVYIYTAGGPGDRRGRRRTAARRVRIGPAETPFIVLASQSLEQVVQMRGEAQMIEAPRGDDLVAGRSSCSLEQARGCLLDAAGQNRHRPVAILGRLSRHKASPA